MKTVFEISKDQRKCYTAPKSKIENYVLEDQFLSSSKAKLPEISEIDFVRHYTELSTRAFGVDNGFYPLGSCTMKYNPKLNEILASLAGFTCVHPLQDSATVQGSLELMWSLADMLEKITGMVMSLQPAAGAHGEYSGLKIIKAYLASIGETNRTKIIVPDSAHGTNPASASLAGFDIVNIPSTESGEVDIDALRAVVDENTAGLMLTNPNTLGIFDRNILSIAEIVHGKGGMLYYDGANLNAIMGKVRPSDMGFDIVHLNIHKTFSTPHGGGGPGVGAVGVVEKYRDFLPTPIVKNDNGQFELVAPSKSIGRVKNFYGNFLVMVKAYAYILSLGSEGIRDASEKAVLNANYLKYLLRDIDFEKERRCMHEFVLSLEEYHHETGVSALDLAKGMIDIGIHPPTMYFPLIVHEALMFEPTETETKETLEDVAGKILKLVHDARENPELCKSAPFSTPISRPDEVTAARNPILRD